MNIFRSKGLWASLVIAPVLAVGLGWLAIFTLVRLDPHKRFTKEAILSLLARQSGVYYADGATLVGSFFEDLHRDYVPFDSIPDTLVQAVVAAEDEDFFHHGGVDFSAIAAAVWEDLRTLSLKRGGSTLTQQTAKNLFHSTARGKWARLQAKIPELLDAYRLERHFSKREILEFYLNQFYVAGNGCGVGIAARYFFDKALGELNLVESAFIAGSVKGPNQYNPFLARSAAERQRKLDAAVRRMHYVLRRLREVGAIDSLRYAMALTEPLQFVKGRFRFALTTNMVAVEQVLRTAPIQAALREYGVEDYARTGLKIITTLDPDIQAGAEYATYHNLSRLDLLFNGYRPPREYGEDRVTAWAPGSFHVGTICSLKTQKKVPAALKLRFGAFEAWVEEAQLEDFLIRWNRHRTGRLKRPDSKALAEFFQENLRIGDTAMCSTPPDADTLENHAGGLDLEQVPEIQGAVRVVRQGRILANVGGFGNTGYDRAEQAKRQFGSTFKPILYAAALELGWSPLDTLWNHRQLFKLGPTFYFPRPDHEPEPRVSLAWAGRKSENVASVYLLYHLLDNLDLAGFWKACARAGFAPESFTGPQAFRAFVRDSLGFALTEDTRRRIQYEQIRADVALDLAFGERYRGIESLQDLPLGEGYAREADSYRGKTDEESRLRLELLRRNFLEYSRLAEDFRSSPSLSRLFQHAGTGETGLFRRTPPAPWYPLAPHASHGARVDPLVDGRVRVSTLEAIQSRLRREPLPPADYMPSTLHASQEFRSLAALRYIAWFARAVGISQPVAPVLSFPLGSSDITLADAVDAYQTLKDGTVYVSPRTGLHHLLIRRIELPGGKIIFEDSLHAQPRLQDDARLAVTAILKEIVQGGTGRRVYSERKLPVGPGGGQTAPLPAYGKTGTTNDHRNGAFIGFIAAPVSSGEFSPREGYTLGAYVGFDDNRTMRHKGFMGFGGAVAIEPWIGTAASIAHARRFSSSLDDLDWAFHAQAGLPLLEEGREIRRRVYLENGLPASPSAPDNACTWFTWRRAHD